MVWKNDVKDSSFIDVFQDCLIQKRSMGEVSELILESVSSSYFIEDEVLEVSEEAYVHFVKLGFQMDSESFRWLERKEKFQLIANKNGNLRLIEKKLELLPFEEESENALKVQFRFFYKELALAKLYNEYLSSFEKFSNHRMKLEDCGISQPRRLDFASFQIEVEKRNDTGEVSLPIVVGLEPNVGQSGRVEKVKFPKFPKEGLDGKVDYHLKSPFIDVEEQELVLVFHHPIEPTAGMDIYGFPIEVNSIEPFYFQFGENLIERKSPEKTEYFSKVDGIVCWEEEKVFVQEAMVVRGDVGPSTGNINTKRNVLVYGDVGTTYSIESKGHVFIHGVVENGVKIKCNGSLSVQSGCFGEETYLHSFGDMFLDFVQGSRLRSQKNIVIKKFIMGSRVFASKSLVVFEEGLSDREKSSVVATEIECKGSISFRKCGEANSDVLINFGFDREVFLALKELNEKIQIQNRKIENLYSSLGFRLTSVQKEELIEGLSKNEKVHLKEKLFVLKKMILKRDQLKKVEADLKQYDEALGQKMHLSIESVFAGRVIVKTPSSKEVIEAPASQVRRKYIRSN